jgi:hypothetical protein
MRASTRALRWLAVVAVALLTAWLGIAPPAASQDDQRVASGIVEQMAGNRLTIGTSTGTLTVETTPNTRYEKEGPGTPQDLRPGQRVGVTGQPSADGELNAVHVRVFPDALNPFMGQRAMGGVNLGNLMTNATITSIDGDILLLSAAGSTYRIHLLPDTEVVMPVPATAGDVQENSRVAVTYRQRPDGMFEALVINLLGQPPELLPPGPPR